MCPKYENLFNFYFQENGYLRAYNTLVKSLNWGKDLVSPTKVLLA